MRTLIIILLLISNYSFGQTYIPASGAIGINQIKTVMFNLGELTSGERTGATTLAFLNGKSHLFDKTAPYSISDWYGYTGAASYYTYSIAAQTGIGSVNASCTSGSATTVYSASSTLTLSVILYTNTSLTTPAPAGSYRVGTTWYYVAGTSVAGEITGTGSC